MKYIALLALVAGSAIAQTSTTDVIITGSLNLLSITQIGVHSTILNLDGNNHNVDILQQGTGSHRSNLALSNQGGAWDFKLNQSGPISKEYNFNGNCYTTGGCNATVTQP